MLTPSYGRTDAQSSVWMLVSSIWQYSWSKSGWMNALIDHISLNGKTTCCVPGVDICLWQVNGPGLLLRPRSHTQLRRPDTRTAPTATGSRTSTFRNRFATVRCARTSPVSWLRTTATSTWVDGICQHSGRVHPASLTIVRWLGI